MIILDRIFGYSMKLLRILLIVPLLMAFQCDEDDPLPIDELDGIGIYGRWEIDSEFIGNISDLLPKCCRFYEFFPDDNPEDQMGLWTYTDETGVFNGVFTLNDDDQNILFERENRTPITYGYSLTDAKDYLTFTFVVDGANYEQGYIRRD